MVVVYGRCRYMIVDGGSGSIGNSSNSRRWW